MSEASAFDPAALVRHLDELGLTLRCVRNPSGALAFAPWHGAGGDEAQRVLLDACQTSANRVALLAYLDATGRYSS